MSSTSISSNREEEEDSRLPRQSPEECRTCQTCSPYFFLTPEAARALHYYEYKGEDRSLLYRYILSPLAQYFVDNYTPKWLAPNVITLTGLLLMLFAYLLLWYHDPLFESPDTVPRWIFLYNAAALLVYQTLDNMDGKQARRTKSGSPLGLLFDHGCDGVNALFGAANWMTAMALHPRQPRDGHLAVIMLLVPYALHTVSAWEEYHTGVMILPLVNGPNEGLLGAALLSLSSWYYGPQMWQQTTAWEQVVLPALEGCVPESLLRDWLLAQPALRNADLLVLASFISSSQEIILKMAATVRRYGNRVWASLAPFGMLVALLLSCGDDMWIRMPRTSLHLIAALSWKITTDLMLAHMTDQEYRSSQTWILWPLAILALWKVVLGGGSSTMTDTYLLVYATSVWTFLGIKVVVVVHEMAASLQIWCFDIVTPRRPSRVKQE